MAPTSTTPRTRSRAKTKPRLSAVTPDDIKGVIEWISTRRLVERELELRLMVAGLLSGTNTHMQGAPGLAKSLGLRELAKCFSGGTYFEKALEPTTPPSAIIGEYDPRALIGQGVLERNIAGTAVAADFVILDEITRSNGATRDALLPLSNVGERHYEAAGGVMARARMLALFTAANHALHEERDAAFVDRITQFVVVQDIKSDDNFKEMLRREHASRMDTAKGSDDRPMLDIEALRTAQAQVLAIELSPEFLDKYVELRRNAKTEGLPISPRKWVELARLCRVPAWLSGRDHVVPDDIVAIEYGLAREDQKSRATASQLIDEFRGRWVREAHKKREEVAQPIAELEGLRPAIENTPPTQDIEPETLKKAINAGRKIDTQAARVRELLAEADREKRDAPDLRELANELKTLQDWRAKVGLPVTI